ncbi:MAG: hypothetical protein ACRCZ9_06240 [Fusobacteriaceae bacterium]
MELNKKVNPMRLEIKGALHTLEIWYKRQVERGTCTGVFGDVSWNGQNLVLEEKRNGYIEIIWYENDYIEAIFYDDNNKRYKKMEVME